ncbi:MAG: nitroreductase family protein [Candidatus Bipolaricaulis sp.]|nr:nitroreductase family protein [Candidatus Bipolaricaulis sp.]
MNGVPQWILQRRSIRRFTGDPVSREKIVTALQAAMAAPSARNLQPWSFLVVTDKASRAAIAKAHPYAGFAADAEAVIIPFGNKADSPWFDQDMAAATENLLLAIAGLGLGATWCGLDDTLQDRVRALVGIPDGLCPFALIPVGVPAEEKSARTQYDEARVHWETYRP